MRKYLAVVSADSTCYRKTCFLDNRKPKPSQIKLRDLLLCSGHKGRYHTQFFSNQQPLISSSNMSPFQIQSKKKKVSKSHSGKRFTEHVKCLFSLFQPIKRDFFHFSLFNLFFCHSVENECPLAARRRAGPVSRVLNLGMKVRAQWEADSSPSQTASEGSLKSTRLKKKKK